MFKWDAACEVAFCKIKEIPTSSPIMAYALSDGGLFYLDVDASGSGLGAVLQQEQAGIERVISYASRSMNRAERNYCVTEQELLAIVFFVQYYRHYLLGRHFVVRSDHKALTWLFSLSEPSGKIARWVEILAPFDFSIQYRPGKLQGHCDALSRCENQRDCVCSKVDTSEPLKCGPCRRRRKRAEDMHLKTKPSPQVR